MCNQQHSNSKPVSKGVFGWKIFDKLGSPSFMINDTGYHREMYTSGFYEETNGWLERVTEKLWVLFLPNKKRS